MHISSSVRRMDIRSQFKSHMRCFCFVSPLKTAIYLACINVKAVYSWRIAISTYCQFLGDRAKLRKATISFVTPTCIHGNISLSFLRMGLFETKVVDKIKTQTFMFHNCYPKSELLWNNVEKYGTARQATNGNIIWRGKYAIHMPDT